MRFQPGALALLAKQLLQGLGEIAERLGVRQQTVAMWRYRGLLPEPSWTVSGLPAWDWPDIARWAVATGRLDAPSPSSPSTPRRKR